MTHPPQPIPDPPPRYGAALPGVMRFDGNPPRSISADDAQGIADFLQAEGLLSREAHCWLRDPEGQKIRLILPHDCKRAMVNRMMESRALRWHREHPAWAAVLYVSLGGLVAYVFEWLGRMWP